MDEFKHCLPAHLLERELLEARAGQDVAPLVPLYHGSGAVLTGDYMYAFDFNILFQVLIT